MIRKMCLFLWLINFIAFVQCQEVVSVLTQRIPGGRLVENQIVRIQGTIPESAKRCTVNFQSGPGDEESVDVGLHFSIEFNPPKMIISARKSKTWQISSQQIHELVIKKGPHTSFEIIISPYEGGYNIVINGYYAKFPFLIPIEKITHLRIRGDIMDIEQVEWKSLSNTQPKLK